MGRVGEVVEVETDGDVRVDLGGEDLVTADGFAGAGDDAPPLPGDAAALVDGVSSGGYQVAGYDDETPKAAAGGERRMYARDPAGVVTSEIHLKGDGSIEITSLASGGAKVTVKPGGNVVIEGAQDVTGDITADGEITAKGASAATLVTLSGLKIPSPFGPLGPPIPGN